MTGLRILITGSRHWRDRDTIRRAIVDTIDRWTADGGCGYVTVVHGGARGADTIAGEIARELRCVVEVHPADWQRYGRAAGPIRNAEMVALGADVCLAWHRGCMRLAEQAGIPVKVYEGAEES